MPDFLIIHSIASTGERMEQIKRGDDKSSALRRYLDRRFISENLLIGELHQFFVLDEEEAVQYLKGEKKIQIQRVERFANESVRY